MTDINLNTNAAILALIPPLLGFVPSDSIVVIHLHRVDDTTTVRCGLRYDVHANAPRAAAAVAAGMRAGTHPGEAVIIVAVVDDTYAAAAQQHLDALRDELHTHAVPTIKRLRTRQLDEADEWTDVDTGARGATHSYRDTALAASAAVEDGRPVVSSREQLAAEFATTTAAAMPRTVHEDLLTATVLTIDAAHTDPGKITPEAAAAAGRIIVANVHKRDALMAFSIERARPGAVVWTRIAAHLRGTARIEALSIAAVCLYIAGDVVRASVATEQAHVVMRHDAVPSTKLLALLDALIQSGISPAQVAAQFRGLNDDPRR